MLCNNNKLAHTSSTPGKTKLLNYFLINENWYLVDLPGYGYAKTGKENREQFAEIIIDYITKRENMVCLFVLIDSRHELQQIDAEFMKWLGEKNIPFCIVFTKCDKLKKSELQKNINHYQQKLLLIFDETPNYIISSSESKAGKEELLHFIGHHYNTSKTH